MRWSSAFVGSKASSSGGICIGSGNSRIYTGGSGTCGICTGGSGTSGICTGGICIADCRICTGGSKICTGGSGIFTGGICTSGICAGSRTCGIFTGGIGPGAIGSSGHLDTRLMTGVMRTRLLEKCRDFSSKGRFSAST
ncbi:hypothetical protein TNCV_880371 [Trichonephila clavipes]|nr:hypothetical protein TNCV_880371 [Trichonephila clavipes]